MPQEHPDRARREPPRGGLLAIAAHPDDIESWCAGTLARAIDAGATAWLLLVTSGDKGSGDPLALAAEVSMRREAEARDAARELGIDAVSFLRYPDGEVEDSRALRGDLVRAIRRWRPDVVFTHDPVHPLPPYLAHRDHRVVGRASLDAVYPLARDRLSYPEQQREGLEPHAVREVWLFASDRPTGWVDVAAGFERKVAARLEHRSQTVDAEALRRDWRERAARIGAEAGISLAEAFAILDLN